MRIVKKKHVIKVNRKHYGNAIKGHQNFVGGDCSILLVKNFPEEIRY